MKRIGNGWVELEFDITTRKIMIYNKERSLISITSLVRKKMGLRIEDLAKKCGLHADVIRCIESGSTKVTLSQLINYCAGLYIKLKGISRGGLSHVS